MSQKWNFLEINNIKYLIKFNRSENVVDCILTNLIVAWHEQITIDKLLDRGKVSTI